MDQITSDSIQYGETKINYEIEFVNRKTLGIFVLPDGNVRLKAPINASLEQIRQKIHKKASWILRQKRFFESFGPPTTKRQFISGESHLYLGRQYMLKVVESYVNAVHYQNNIIEIECRNKKNAGTLFSEEDLNNATKAKEQLIAFNYELERLANITGRIVLKPLTDVIKELTEFLKDPKKYIANVFSEGTANNPSEYKVAKDMLNPMSMLKWYGDRMIGLTNYSATTGLSGVSDWWTGLMTAGNNNTKVENNVSMTITGSNSEEIANKVTNNINKITEASIKQSSGAR